MAMLAHSVEGRDEGAERDLGVDSVREDDVKRASDPRAAALEGFAPGTHRRGPAGVRDEGAVRRPKGQFLYPRQRCAYMPCPPSRM